MRVQQVMRYPSSEWRAGDGRRYLQIWCQFFCAGESRLAAGDSTWPGLILRLASPIRPLLPKRKRECEDGRCTVGRTMRTAQLLS